MTDTPKNVTILDLDTILDTEMSSIATLPDFITPPAGLYMLKVTESKIEKYDQKPKTAGGQPVPATRIKIFYAVEQTLETSDAPVKDGSLFSESFMGTQEGIEYFKRQAMNIMNVSDMDGATMKDVIAGLKDQPFKAKITIRKTRNPDGGEFENVQVRPVHESPVAKN